MSHGAERYRHLVWGAQCVHYSGSHALCNKAGFLKRTDTWVTLHKLNYCVIIIPKEIQTISLFNEKSSLKTD